MAARLTICSAAASHNPPRGRHSKKRSRLSGSGRGGIDVGKLTVSSWELAYVVLMAVWAGSHIGHILTLWQVEAKNSHNQSDKRDE